MTNQDNTAAARRMALENSAICSHRYKEEDPPQFAWCADCRTQLLRQANPKKTGKTRRKREGERS